MLICAVCLEEMVRSSLSTTKYRVYTHKPYRQCYYTNAYDIETLIVDRVLFLNSTYNILPPSAQFGLYTRAGNFKKCAALTA
jgi:hypothetical protein